MEFQGFGSTSVSNYEKHNKEQEKINELNESVLHQIGKGVWDTLTREINNQGNFPVERIIQLFDSEEISNDNKEALIDIIMEIKTPEYDREDAESKANQMAVVAKNKEIVRSIDNFMDSIDF